MAVPAGDAAIRKITQFLMVASLVSACGTDEAQAPASAKHADVVYHSGKIWTVNPARPVARAVAIRDGRIVFVGSDDAVRVHIGPRTRMHNLRGKLMLPAFQDAHIHPISAGMEAALCDLNNLGDLAAYREAIAAYAADNPGIEWITGGGWTMNVFGPGALASKAVLDELVPDRPVYLSSADGHSGWANSRALEIAGITKDTPDPPDGIIDRDPETGEPIGSLQEGAMNLVERHVPPTTAEQRLQGLIYARDLLHGYGITSIQAAYAYEDDLDTYAKADEAGQLDLRVVAALWWDREDTEEQLPGLVELRKRFTRGNLRATTVKIMQDGVMENYTAVMLKPYLVPGGTRGIPMLDPEFLKTAVTLLDKAGFQVHFHAIGDGAVRQTLDAIEAALEANGPSGNRHHVSHLQIIDPADVPRFKELDVAANFQPLWAYNDAYVVELTTPFIGEERARRMYPIRAVADAGGRLAFGSDWSVSTANPFPQIETAVTRVDPETHATQPLNPEQAISVEQAIAAFTIGSAWVNGHDDETGSIEVGKLADLIVVDRDLFSIEPVEISDARVLLTLFGGRPVHGDPDAL